jgi:hypothetical protein
MVVVVVVVVLVLLLVLLLFITTTTGARGGTVVEALRYKLEGRRINSRWCHWNFSLT